MSDKKHEIRDVNVRVISLMGLGLLVSIVLSAGIVLGLFRFFASQHGPTFETNRQPPEPRLQADPGRDLQKMRAMEDEILQSYGWVDTNAGVVRIPIDRAMQLVVERNEEKPK